MKKNFFIVIFCFFWLFGNGQTQVLNKKLLEQLTKNQAVRLSSDKLFFDSYEKQKKLYDDINKKITQIVAIHEYIYHNLKNVNSAILQGKKLFYFYEYLGKIGVQSNEMLNLTAQHPEYAILINKYYISIANDVIKLREEVMNTVLHEETNFLMDSMDREILLEQIFMRARQIHGKLLYINYRLKNAKKTPYLYQVPTLSNYINLDKAIVTDILNQYKYLF